MTTIWKYPLRLQAQVQEFTMPSGARVLSVQNQSGEICMWARVDPAAAKVNRRFVIFGTGQPMRPTAPTDGEMEFCGTVQTHEGDYVWHIFEMLPKAP